MRILIKENHKTKLSLWLPSGNLVIRTFLRYFEVDGVRFNLEQRKAIMAQIKTLRKLHRPLILVDIERQNGDVVLIKL
jgi:hypothetical protein